MEELNKHLDKIATFLSEGEIWHRKSANELRKMPNKRGFARWHEAESDYDQKEHLKLDKLIRDNLKYAPMVDMAYVAKAESYTIADKEAFKQHFKQWITREKVFLESINAAIALSGSADMQIYQCLCCLAKEVKNEAVRAEWGLESFVDTGWEGHDIRVVSKWLHDYFEEKYSGGTIDFNIG